MRRMSADALPPTTVRVTLSLLAPLGIGLIILRVLLNLLSGNESQIAVSSIFLTLVGLISWFMGLTWYGTKGMGLRGGRPLFSSAGFAFMGWVVILLARVWFVSIDENLFGQQTLWQDFFYLLMFEGFAVSIWIYGLLFRSVSDWRGGLTAAVVCGLVFGGTGYFIFRESFHDTFLPILYFAIWGIFYGMIRLRTGSLLGLVVVQAMQSLTAWFLFPPIQPVGPDNFNTVFYIVMGICYLILVWRLWPKEEDDYRI